MRWILPLMLAVIWVAPSAGAPLRGECRTLTRQIHHFEGVVQLAEERGNELWERETRRHIARLERRRERRCPEFAPRESALVGAARLVGKAARKAAGFLVP